jgi:hypothetical protein
MDADRSAEVGRDRRGWQPSLYRFFMVPAISGCLVLASVAAVYYFEGSCRFSDCVEQVPYSRALIPLAALALLVKLLEGLRHKLHPSDASS